MDGDDGSAAGMKGEVPRWRFKSCSGFDEMMIRD